MPTRATADRALEHLAAELTTADFICDQSPLEYLGLEGATSDAAPRHLFREALTLYNDANREYLEGRHTNPSLMLESAKRGTRHQALGHISTLIDHLDRFAPNLAEMASVSAARKRTFGVRGHGRP